MRDSNGDAVRFLNAIAAADDSGDVTVYYQPVKQSLLDSARHGEWDYANPYLTPGMTTNLDRVIYRTTIPGDQLEAMSALPPGEIADADLAGDHSVAYQVMAEMIGQDYDGTLSTEINGSVYGGMVLPYEQKPLNPVDVSEEGAAPGDGDFAYEVYEHGQGPDGYWVIEYFSTPEQVTFDVTVPKGIEEDTPTEAPPGTGNYLPAQIYFSESCTRFDDEPDWTCTSLLDYAWGAGGGLDATEPLVTDDIVRGTFDIPELPQSLIDAGVNPDREYMRGIFGNDRCMVTRDTENPEDYSALASTILPSDYNDRFPGQQQNAVGPANKLRENPFAYEIELEGLTDGIPFTSDDGCDQAAVALVCSPPEEPTSEPSSEPSEPTSEPSESSEPSSEPTSEPSGTSEPSESGSTTEPSEPSGTSSTTEPSAPGGSTTTGPDGKTTIKSTTTGPDGKPTVKPR